MSSAFAHPLPPSPLVTASERRVVVVMADAATGDADGRLVTGTLQRWAGRVAVREVAELADDVADAVVLLADLAAPPGLAALRRIHTEQPAARLVVVARDGSSTSAARQALNAGAD